MVALVSKIFICLASTVFGGILPGIGVILYARAKFSDDGYDFDDVGPGEYHKGYAYFLLAGFAAFCGAVVGLAVSISCVLLIK